MDPDEIDKVDGKRLELTQDYVLWCAVVVAMLILLVLLWETEMDLKKTSSENGKWMELAHEHVRWHALVSVVSNHRMFHKTWQGRLYIALI